MHINLSKEEINHFAEITKKLKEEYKNVRIALIADRDVVYGQFRMFEVFGELSGVERYVYRDPGDALKWLGIDPQQVEHIGLNTIGILEG